MHSYSFDYLLMDNLLATVTVDLQNNKVSVTNYTDDIIDRPFGVNENPNMDDLKRLFEYRCVPRSRFNIKRLLQDFPMGYDEYAILRRTHGIMSDDYYWIRFDDEKHLTWDDVKYWKYH